MSPTTGVADTGERRARKLARGVRWGEVGKVPSWQLAGPLPNVLVATDARSYAKQEVIEDWRHYVRVLLEKPFALPFASALRHALANGELPAHWERLRQDLVARRSDGNREFARILELAATHPLAEVDGALRLAAEHPDWNADRVRHLLDWLKNPSTSVAPLAAARYPAYQLTLPPPDLERYNRLLEVRS